MRDTLSVMDEAASKKDRVVTPAWWEYQHRVAPAMKERLRASARATTWQEHMVAWQTYARTCKPHLDEYHRTVAPAIAEYDSTRAACDALDAACIKYNQTLAAIRRKYEDPKDRSSHMDRAVERAVSRINASKKDLAAAEIEAELDKCFAASDAALEKCNAACEEFEAKARAEARSAEIAAWNEYDRAVSAIQKKYAQGQE